MKNASRVFWGLGFIAVAIFLVLSQMNLITASISVWSAVIGILCLAILISGIANRSFGGIFFALGLFWVTFAEVLGLPQVSFWTVMVIVIFLTIGFNMLFPHKHRKSGEDCGRHGGSSDYTQYQKVKEEESDGYVECTNTFGELTKYVNTVDFKKGRFENSFGELKVYLDQAQVTGQSVNLEVRNSFGQITLFVPREWKVVQNVNVFLASVDEKSSATGTSEITCYLDGSVSFGDIEIIYV